MIVIAVTKDTLMRAADFKANEKTAFDKVKDKAAELGRKAADEAVYLKDKAADKIEDMRKSEPEKNYEREPDNGFFALPRPAGKARLTPPLPRI